MRSHHRQQQPPPQTDIKHRNTWARRNGVHLVDMGTDREDGIFEGGAELGFSRPCTAHHHDLEDSARQSHRAAPRKERMQFGTTEKISCQEEAGHPGEDTPPGGHSPTLVPCSRPEELECKGMELTRMLAVGTTRKDHEYALGEIVHLSWYSEAPNYACVCVRERERVRERTMWGGKAVDVDFAVDASLKRNHCWTQKEISFLFFCGKVTSLNAVTALSNIGNTGWMPAAHSRTLRNSR